MTNPEEDELLNRVNDLTTKYAEDQRTMSDLAQSSAKIDQQTVEFKKKAEALMAEVKEMKAHSDLTDRMKDSLELLKIIATIEEDRVKKGEPRGYYEDAEKEEGK
jgi:hypothetical protein